MSIRKQPEPAKGGKRLSWKANLLFAAVVLAAAALLFWLLRPRSKACLLYTSPSPRDTR